MQNMILLLFGIFFSLGSFLILAHLFKVPTLKTTKAVINIGKKHKKQARNSDAFIRDLAVKFAPYLPMNEYKKRKLTATLRSAEIKLTPEVYICESYIKTALVAVWTLPCLLIVPIISPVFVIIAIGVYFSESTKADKLIKQKREDIEYELPRFVATLTQSFSASRDVRTIIDTYIKNAGQALKNELVITSADMGTGNYEAALTRFETRVSSAMLSDVVRGLIGVVRGDDGVTYFAMLSHDMKQLELQRLKKLAMERPPKIRKYSFMLLGCMLLLYMGVMGYQIIGTMSGIY